MSDLFGHAEAPPMMVRLDRGIDRQQPCHDNIAVIRPGKAQHAGELRCAQCDRHRGWLPREALNFLTDLAQQFGAPTEPLTLRDQQIGDHVMADKQYDNSGILFKNDDKDPANERDRDYQGSLTVNGTEYWLSAWIKQGKKGKFMSLSVKPKDAPKAATKSGGGVDFDDQIPFAPEVRG